ncbi:RnfH family protein [Orbus sturtevantii]|uniref:RnfH family protein n=1 Tax=Orbus sturtevantii TaxID=3074109 RepID=UPI00370D8316
MINIQIVYALPENPMIIDCSVDNNCTVEQAIAQSNILQQHNLTLENHQIGIYGKPIALNDRLNDGDRIEIYRPLINDPKEIRRKRSIGQQKKRRQANESR